MKNFQIMNGGQFKKGFTLIELLTVIVILGILALITTPVITNLINNARKNTFKNSAYGIVQAANQYYLNSKLTGENFDEITFIVNNDKLMSENKELSFTGKSPIGSSYVKINSRGEIAINITDGTYFATKEYDETGVLITGEESNAVSREELANRVTQLEKLLQNTKEELILKDEQLSGKIDNNTLIIEDLKNEELNSNQIFLLAYPVGSVYISLESTNPGEKYGGTWERYANGKTLVGVSETETEFATVNKTGGEKTHTLTISEMPSHSHRGKIGYNQSGYGYTTALWEMYVNTISSPISNSGSSTLSDINTHNIAPTGNTGESKSHNNLQPYITVYMWKRTA